MTENAEQQDQKPEVEQEPKIGIGELMEKVQMLEASNGILEANKGRLLEESKSWKTKYQGIKSDVEQQETVKLQETNDFKGLYERSQAEIVTLKENANASRKVELETSLKYEVAKTAPDADDPEILLAAIKLKKSDLLGYDRETGKWKGIGDAVEDLRKSNPKLFVSDKPGMINGRPQSTVPRDKTVEEMINENPEAVLKNAITELLSP